MTEKDTAPSTKQPTEEMPEEDLRSRLVGAEIRKLEADLNLRRTTAAQEHQVIELQLQQKSIELQSIQHECDNHRGELEQLSSRQTETIRTLEVLKSEIIASQHKRQAIETEIATLTIEINRLREKKETEELLVQEQQKEREVLIDKLHDIKHQLEIHQQRQTSTQSEAQALNLAIASERAQLATLDEERTRREEILKKLESDICGRQEILEDLRQQVAKILDDAQNGGTRVANEIIQDAKQRTIEHMAAAKAKAKRQMQEHESECEQLLIEARTHASQIIEEAEAQKHQLIADANAHILSQQTEAARREKYLTHQEDETRKVADALIEQAKEEVTLILSKSQAEVECRLATAHVEALSIIAQAQNREKLIISDAGREGEAAIAEGRGIAESLVKEAQLRAKQTLSKADEERETLLKSTHEQIESMVSLAQKQAENLLTQADQEVQQIRQAEQNLLLQTRQDALVAMEQWKTQEEHAYRTQVKKISQKILGQMEQAIQVAIERILGRSSASRDLQPLASDIRRVVEVALASLSSEMRSEIPESMLHVDLKAVRRSGRYWVDVATRILIPAVSICAVIAVWFLRQPPDEMAAKSLSELAEQRTTHRRSQEPLLQFASTPEGKISYTDDVLQTTNFKKIYYSQEFQKAWTIGLIRFIDRKLNLDADLTAKVLGKEKSLLKRLLEVRDNLTPEIKNAGIERMREIEKEVEREIRDDLGDPARARKFMEYRKSFYDQYCQQNEINSNKSVGK